VVPRSPPNSSYRESKWWGEDSPPVFEKRGECRDDTGANVQSIHDVAEFEYAEEARYAVEMRKFELINFKFYK
jgi:hypothetical protein